MAQFKIKQKESAGGKKATFNKSEDFKVVQLIKKVKDATGKETTTKGDPKVLHTIQANRLISKGKAVEVKDAKVEQKRSTRTVKKLEDK